jgi:3',5'-cyclic AMP phosphodiesterase CpdA
MLKENVDRRIFLTQAGAWLLPACAAQPLSAAKPVARLGIVTDIHYANRPTAGTRQYRDSIAKLTEAVAQWNSQQVDAVIQLGDFVDASPTVELELADLRRVVGVLREVRAPRYFAIGNHCVFTLTKPQFLEAWGAERSWYAFPLPGYRGIVLDSAFTSDGRPYGGREFDWRDAFVPPEQLEWLAAELRRGGGEPAVVFVHHRLDGDDHYTVRNAPAVRAVLEASGRVIAVFQGHNHINDYRMIGGIQYCTLKAMVDGPPPDSSAYGTLEFYPDRGLHLHGFRLLESRRLAAG